MAIDSCELETIPIGNWQFWRTMPKTTPITVANGDGIGREIMAATLEILKGAGAALEIEMIDIGEKVYLAGNSSGIEPSSWDSLRFFEGTNHHAARRRL